MNRDRGRGMEIRIEYGVFDTPLGVALLAATSRGLCALRLCQVHGPQEQLHHIRADFPTADFVDAPAAVQAYADQLVAFLNAQTDTFRPPLDVLRGTPFQREVWATLQTLRPGETVSYTTLAHRIGRPSAVRAVGGACASNQIAIAIPCHRAVRSDGSLAGFRWGLEWKQRLLEIESGLKRA